MLLPLECLEHLDPPYNTTNSLFYPVFRLASAEFIKGAGQEVNKSTPLILIARLSRLVYFAV